MCEANLIDFSFEDVCSDGESMGTATTAPLLVNTASASLQTTFLIPPPLHGRESIDNNPFDSAQKLANRPPDPFEIVEKEACLKARCSKIKPAEVRLAKLLSLSDDNILNDAPAASGDRNSCIDLVPRTSSNVTTNFSANSISIYHSAVSNDLLSKSPPLSMSMNVTPESGGIIQGSDDVGDQNFGSSTDGNGNKGISVKTKKSLEYRKRLLKLSISNSTFNSPVSHHAATPPSITGDSAFFAESNCCSSISAIFSEAALSGDHLLASESPLKLIDDDLMSEEPPKNFTDSEKDFDADLEMLKIPILKDLSSPVVDQSSSVADIQLTTRSELSVTNEAHKDKGLHDLTALRAKLRTKRELADSQSNLEISHMIENLKSLISLTDVVDVRKKDQANCLLETLSLVWVADQEDDPNCLENKSKSMEPKPIIRQGTFDLDLQQCSPQENAQKPQHSPDSTSIGEGSSDKLVEMETAPEIMIRSSATYDGDTPTDKAEYHLELPEVDLVHKCAPSDVLSPQPDVQDIIDQLSKLLEQHKLSQQPLSGSAEEAAARTANITATSALNPTFIVVMNTTPFSAANPTALQECTLQSSNAVLAKCLDRSFSDSSPDMANSSSVMRRRSQSLSLHDKLKIVQLPLPPPLMSDPNTAAVIGQNTVMSPNSTSPFNATVAAPEFKTPMMRRNSFSSGTPFTPNRHSKLAPETSEKCSYLRRSTALETHHERQQQQHAIVHPMPFKPDLRKKLKSSSAADSIVKSSGPLKATIPVTKVAPMLKAEYTLGDGATTANSMRRCSSNSLNNSMHLLTKPSKMSYTSTPMPTTRISKTERGVLIAGFPNACSTPTVFGSPSKRGGINSNKLRYSHLSVTPNAKAMASSSVAATSAHSDLKRRTISDFKVKSPIKPRVSRVGNSTRVPPYVARIPNRGASAVGATPSIGERTFTGQLNLLTKRPSVTTNKENRKP